ncbi:MAG TPA: dienelactone hydrolase family protein, partial [Planctomycetaceae bacterium]
NVFGLLERFGDAELAAMVAPRTLVIEAAKGPEVTILGEGGAPAELVSPALENVRGEVERGKRIAERVHGASSSIALVASGEEGQGPAGSPEALRRLLKALGSDRELRNAGPTSRAEDVPVDPEARLRRQIVEMDRFTQRLLEESPYVRAEFMKKLDTSSVEAYRDSSKPYREFFRTDVIGAFDERLIEPNPRARKAYDTPTWTGYEIVLDVFDGFFAYGVLLVPKDVEPGERRPVVVCQHGLEGRPQDIVSGDHPAYHDFAAKLAERGFVVFAPQHLYLFGDRFRTLQRKANPVGKTLFSLMVPQHEQLLRWLRTLPFVDGERIGFYGLSYGGKSAMRIPALVEGYALSICSADFNDWVWKNASTRSPYSYVWTNEYEIFEFDVGSTFNYAEMAALIAPRPFMVERGHFDGVAPDERVAYEYAKVRHLYAAKLKRPDLTEIEFFDGPHTINGQGTFRFLHRHLNRPEPSEAE